MLNINKKIENGKAVFTLEGRLDMITAPMLEEQVLASLDGVTELILDFKDLMYISSAGIRVLLTAQEISLLPGSGCCSRHRRRWVSRVK